MIKTKVEKRGNSVFISHDGLTVFFNRYGSEYGIKATYRETNNPMADKWLEAGRMSVDRESMDKLVKLLAEL